jgi:hypothetical protein
MIFHIEATNIIIVRIEHFARNTFCHLAGLKCILTRDSIAVIVNNVIRSIDAIHVQWQMLLVLFHVIGFGPVCMSMKSKLKLKTFGIIG